MGFKSPRDPSRYGTRGIKGRDVAGNDRREIRQAKLQPVENYVRVGVVEQCCGCG